VTRVDWIPDSVDVGRPSTARMYDYVLGGGHNLEADRLLADKMLEIQPEIRRFAIMNRSFLRRAVLFMIDAGIRQFLDLGSGIPTVGNVHEIAQQADPESRIVYVDVEPVAVAHSRMILEGNDNAVMVHADITEPDMVLFDQETRRMLDFDRPIGLLAVTVGHHVAAEQDPVGVFGRYADAVVPGSVLAITHASSDFPDNAKSSELARRSQISISLRTRAEILELFKGFALIPPGLVTTSQWHPDRDDEAATNPAEDGMYAGVGQKA
jgi:S-adenosyl methyltransferase